MYNYKNKTDIDWPMEKRQITHKQHVKCCKAVSLLHMSFMQIGVFTTGVPADLWCIHQNTNSWHWSMKGTLTALLHLTTHTLLFSHALPTLGSALSRVTQGETSSISCGVVKDAKSQNTVFLHVSPKRAAQKLMLTHTSDPRSQRKLLKTMTQMEIYICNRQGSKWLT